MSHIPCCHQRPESERIVTCGGANGDTVTPVGGQNPYAVLPTKRSRQVCRPKPSKLSQKVRDFGQQQQPQSGRDRKLVDQQRRAVGYSNGHIPKNSDICASLTHVLASCKPADGIMLQPCSAASPSSGCPSTQCTCNERSNQPYVHSPDFLGSSSKDRSKSSSNSSNNSSSSSGSKNNSSNGRCNCGGSSNNSNSKHHGPILEKKSSHCPAGGAVMSELHQALHGHVSPKQPPPVMSKVNAARHVHHTCVEKPASESHSHRHHHDNRTTKTSKSKRCNEECCRAHGQGPGGYTNR